MSDIWKYIGGLFVLGLGVGAFRYGVPGRVGVAVSILGTALILTFIPCVVAIPWRLIQQRNNKMTATPFAVGAAIFLFLALSSLNFDAFERILP